MASIVVAGDTSGTVTLAAPAVSGTTTLTLPTTSGTVLTSASTITPSAGTVNQAALATGVAGTGPAFSAYLNGNQSITSGVETVVQLNAELFDTNSCFNTSTYRFTPTVAGYYQINALIRRSGASPTNTWISILKNGAIYYRGQEFDTSTAQQVQLQANTIIYMNGTTDYIQLSGFIAGTSPVFADAGGGTGVYTCAMNGFLARAA